jgi:hypothetical protein
MLERYAFYPLLTGIALGVLAYLWLLVRAWRVRRAWGIAVLLPPLAPLFVLCHFSRAKAPLRLFALAGLLIGGTYATNYYFHYYHFDLGPREKIVEGQRHITLTGWDRNDYSVLQFKPDTVVLQMANSDVTDETLEYLKPMKQLQELDLNDTQISDVGLCLLAEMPNLQILRLRKTQVTDQGFKDCLAGNETLRELDLRETKVASKTLREWKEKKKDERRFLR